MNMWLNRKPMIQSSLKSSLKSSLISSLALLFGLILMHAPMWLKGHSLGWDAMNESWGDLRYAIQSLQAGYFPFWNHLERGGYPFIADPQTAVFYPINWLIYLMGMLFGLGPWLAVLRSLVHYMIAAVGCHVLALSWRASSSLSLLFTSLYLYSGRLLKSKDNAGLWTMVWLPWLFWALHKLIEKPTYKSACIFSILLTFSFYAGYPPNLARSLIFLTIWGIYLLINIYRQLSQQQQAWPKFFKYLKSLVFSLTQAVIMTVLLCAPGIVSTLQVLAESQRTKLSLAELLMSRFQLVDTFDMLSPRLVHEQSYALTYIGLVGLCLVILFICTRAIAKTERIFMFMLALTTLLWTCGRNVHFLEYFVKYIPTFNLWRIAEQYAFLTVFCTSLMALKAGLMIEKASSQQQEQTLSFLKNIALILSLLLFSLLGIATFQSASLSSGLLISLLVSVSIYVLLGDFDWRGSRLSHLWLALCLLSFVDIAFQQQKLVKISQALPKTTRDRLLTKTAPFQRFADHQYLRWRPAARLKVADLSGRYSTMVNRRWHRYIKAAEKAHNLYAWGSVQQLFKRGKRPQLIKKSAPYAYWTTEIQQFANSTQLLNHMKKHSPQQGLKVFVETDSELLNQKPKHSLTRLKQSHLAQLRSVQIKQAEWGHIQLEINTSQAGYVVINERYSPWWRYKLNQGAWQASHRANYMFQALYVPKGKHQIHLEYHEKPTLFALIVSGLTWVLMLVFYVSRSWFNYGSWRLLT